MALFPDIVAIKFLSDCSADSITHLMPSLGSMLRDWQGQDVRLELRLIEPVRYVPIHESQVGQIVSEMVGKRPITRLRYVAEKCRVRVSDGEVMVTRIPHISYSLSYTGPPPTNLRSVIERLVPREVCDVAHFIPKGVAGRTAAVYLFEKVFRHAVLRDWLYDVPGTGPSPLWELLRSAEQQFVLEFGDHLVVLPKGKSTVSKFLRQCDRVLHERWGVLEFERRLDGLPITLDEWVKLR